MKAYPHVPDTITCYRTFSHDLISSLICLTCYVKFVSSEQNVKKVDPTGVTWDTSLLTILCQYQEVLAQNGLKGTFYHLI